MHMCVLWFTATTTMPIIAAMRDGEVYGEEGSKWFMRNRVVMTSNEGGDDDLRCTLRWKHVKIMLHVHEWPHIITCNFSLFIFSVLPLAAAFKT